MLLISVSLNSSLSLRLLLRISLLVPTTPSPDTITPKHDSQQRQNPRTDCFLPSWPELRRCSPRSQPNTLSFRIPRCFSFCFVGRDFMNVRRKVMSLPCFFDTAQQNGKKPLYLRFDKAKHDTLRTVVTLPPTIDRNRFSKVRH